MTNIDRATELLWLLEPHLSTSECDDQARELAQALADAGLLMPDLPEPDNTYPEWLAGGASISPVPDAGEVTIEWEDREDTGRGTMARIKYLTTDQVLAILAAASYTERNQE
ncbi:hypothetical protein [Corynebacterium nuruki]|uniref:hypothetical protein n=1 Tax=Corynebacterium nuruki TaxID=1032851 RepID=UPI0039BFFBD4